MMKIIDEIEVQQGIWIDKKWLEEAGLNDRIKIVINEKKIYLVSAENKISEEYQKSSKPGLHLGSMSINDDFDEPLPDSFWLGEE